MSELAPELVFAGKFGTSFHGSYGWPRFSCHS